MKTSLGVLIDCPCSLPREHSNMKLPKLPSRSGAETIGCPFPVFQNRGNNIALHRETNNNKGLKNLSSYFKPILGFLVCAQLWDSESVLKERSHFVVYSPNSGLLFQISPVNFVWYWEVATATSRATKNNW